MFSITPPFIVKEAAPLPNNVLPAYTSTGPASVWLSLCISVIVPPFITNEALQQTRTPPVLARTFALRITPPSMMKRACSPQTTTPPDSVCGV